MCNNQEFIKVCDKYIETVIGRQLNAEQTKAALNTCGPELIIAGAGTGKTTVLINRIINLLRFGTAYQLKSYDRDKFSESLFDKLINCVEDEGVYNALRSNAPKPQNILVVTFTNKAAGELKTRIGKAIGQELAKDVNAQTFHSLCARLLRIEYKHTGFSSHFTIYDSEDCKKLMKNIIKEVMENDETANIELDALTALGYIQSFKDNLISVKDVENNIAKGVYDESIEKIYASLYKRYQDELRKANAMDFDDLIYNMVTLLQGNRDILEKYQNRFLYVMVDEYQDTSKAQSTLVDLLAGGWLNVCVVGDEDQSIYGFRGAQVDNILKFPDRYPSTYVVKLERNYRSTQNILKFANSIISNNKHRTNKALWTSEKSGSKIEDKESYSAMDEATWVANEIADNKLDYSNTAILYRMNAQSAAFEQIFIHKKIPYKIIGGLKFFDRKEVKDIIAYLQILVNPKDNLRVRRIINVPARKIGSTTVDKVENMAKAMGIQMIDICRQSAKYPELKRQSKALSNFVRLYDDLHSDLNNIPLADLTEHIYNLSGYENQLISTANFEEKRLNIVQLSRMADEFEKNNPGKNAQDFLEEISLLSDADSYDSSKPSVTLMTIHASKGLEFNNVFLVGWNDDLFPTSRAIQQSVEDPEAMEEERRLAYVAITRAKKRLFISWMQEMMLWGSSRNLRPSRFIYELDGQVCENRLKTSKQKSREEVLDHYMKTVVIPECGRDSIKPTLPKEGDKVKDHEGHVFNVFGITDMGKCHIVLLKDSFGNSTRVIWEYANIHVVD